MSKVTRDRINDCEEMVDSIFYDKVFNLTIHSKDLDNRLCAFDILCNIMESEKHRNKLQKGDYFREVFEKMNTTTKL